VGQTVECKSSPDGPIHIGTVISLHPLITRVPGFVDGRWRYTRAKQCSNFVLGNVTNVYSTPDSRGALIEKLNMGVEVGVMEYVGDFAHIVSPTNGWIDMKQAAPASAVAFEPTVNTPAPVLPTIEVLVLQGMSAKDLAMCCQNAGALPWKVSLRTIGGQLVGVVSFQDHQSAETVLSRGIVHHCWTLQMKWSQAYLDFCARQTTI